MMFLVNWFDIAVLVVIMLCAGDALRQVRPIDEPWRAAAFTLVTIGAFGWIAYDLHGLAIRWWALSMHTGFAIYAAVLFRARHPLRRKTDVDASGRATRRIA